MLLLVVVDQGVVVALAALQVPTQEQPADVARDEVRIGLAVEQEPRRGTGGRVGSVGRQDLPDEHVIGPVLGERLVQKLAPGCRRHVQVGASLHQHHVEDLLHPPGVGWAIEQAVDQRLTLVGRRIVEKRAGLGRRRGSCRPGRARPAAETRHPWPARLAAGPAARAPAVPRSGGRSAHAEAIPDDLPWRREPTRRRSTREAQPWASFSVRVRAIRFRASPSASARPVEPVSRASR